MIYDEDKMRKNIKNALISHVNEDSSINETTELIMQYFNEELEHNENRVLEIVALRMKTNADKIRELEEERNRLAEEKEQMTINMNNRSLRIKELEENNAEWEKKYQSLYNTYSDVVHKLDWIIENNPLCKLPPNFWEEK